MTPLMTVSHHQKIAKPGWLHYNHTPVVKIVLCRFISESRSNNITQSTELKVDKHFEHICVELLIVFLIYISWEYPKWYQYPLSWNLSGKCTVVMFSIIDQKMLEIWT